MTSRHIDRVPSERARPLLPGDTPAAPSACLPILHGAFHIAVLRDVSLRVPYPAVLMISILGNPPVSTLV